MYIYIYILWCSIYRKILESSVYEHSKRRIKNEYVKRFESAHRSGESIEDTYLYSD